METELIHHRLNAGNLVRQLKAELKAHKALMRADGIRAVSCFNAGISRAEYSANKELFSLKTKLALAQKQEQELYAPTLAQT